MFLVKDCSKEE